MLELNTIENGSNCQSNEQKVYIAKRPKVNIFLPLTDNETSSSTRKVDLPRFILKKFILFWNV